MKKNIIIIILSAFCPIKSIYAQQQGSSYDSAKVYSMQFYATSQHINQHDILFFGDSVLITDLATVQRLYTKLMSIKDDNISSDSLCIKRDKPNAETMNVRGLFIFYKNNKRTCIGISPQRLMFINGVVFNMKNIRFEKVITEPTELYKNLFPTKEDVLNKIQEM